MRLIDANALQMNNIWYLNDNGEECIKVDDIANAPTIEERKTGKWISEMVDGEDWKGCKRQYYQPISCSKCHSPNLYKSAYCPNCGAKMEVTNEDSN